MRQQMAVIRRRQLPSLDLHPVFSAAHRSCSHVRTGVSRPLQIFKGNCNQEETRKLHLCSLPSKVRTACLSCIGLI